MLGLLHAQARQMWSMSFSRDSRRILAITDHSQSSAAVRNLEIDAVAKQADEIAGIRQRYPQIAILLMTGFADQRERASGLNAIVHDVVTKPFSVADIRTAVADALAARKA